LEFHFNSTHALNYKWSRNKGFLYLIRVKLNLSLKPKKIARWAIF